jgi:hypothetical protein
LHWNDDGDPEFLRRCGQSAIECDKLEFEPPANCSMQRIRRVQFVHYG